MQAKVNEIVGKKDDDSELFDISKYINKDILSGTIPEVLDRSMNPESNGRIR